MAFLCLFYCISIVSIRLVHIVTGYIFSYSRVNNIHAHANLFTYNFINFHYSLIIWQNPRMYFFFDCCTQCFNELRTVDRHISDFISFMYICRKETNESCTSCTFSFFKKVLRFYNNYSNFHFHPYTSVPFPQHPQKCLLSLVTLVNSYPYR